MKKILAAILLLLTGPGTFAGKACCYATGTIRAVSPGTAQEGRLYAAGRYCRPGFSPHSAQDLSSNQPAAGNSICVPVRVGYGAAGDTAGHPATAAVHTLADPAGALLTFRVTGNGTEQVAIWNSLGQLMHTGLLRDSASVNTAYWPSGIYYIKTNAGTEKVMILH